MITQIATVFCLLIVCSAAAPCCADVSGMYPRAELEKTAPRLSAAVTKIYDLGVKPYLTPDERAKLGAFEFRFPLPSPSDEVLNFYAEDAGGKPILSLQIAEDMATAYAWLYQNGMSLGTIDFYFSMLRHKRKADLPSGKYPPLLATLGIPGNALEDQRIEKLSLGFRNQALAFVLVHELGHILYKHKSYDVITKG